MFRQPVNHAFAFNAHIVMDKNSASIVATRNATFGEFIAALLMTSGHTSNETISRLE